MSAWEILTMIASGAPAALIGLAVGIGLIAICRPEKV